MAITFLINTPYLEPGAQDSEFDEKNKNSREDIYRRIHQSQICYRNYQKFFEEVYDDWAFFQIANQHYTHIIACKHELEKEFTIHNAMPQRVELSRCLKLLVYSQNRDIGVH